MSRRLENEEGGDRELEPKVGEIYLRGFKAQAPSAGSSSSRLRIGYIDGQIWRGEIGVCNFCGIITVQCFLDLAE